jgi:hypothetical protein
MAAKVWTDVRLFWDAYNLSGDINALALNYGVELEDATVLLDASRRRRAGLKTIAFQHEGFVNLGADQIDDVLFNDIAVANVPMTICPHNSAAEGEIAFFFQGLAGQYQPGAPVGEMHRFSVSGGADDGRDLIRGTVMHNATRTASGNGTARQLGSVSATQKLYAALHVFDSVAGTTPTLDVKVQSDDASGFASPIDRITFAQKTAKGSQYATPVDGPITDNWFRITYAIGGTSPSFTFVVVLGVQ